MPKRICWLAVALLVGLGPLAAPAKSYSGGGHSYSSHSSSPSSSSHSFSSSHSSGSGHTFSSGSSSSHSSTWTGSSSHSSGSGSSRNFGSGSGHSYSSSSSWSDDGRKSYTSGKGYSFGSGHTFSSLFRDESPRPPTSKPSPGTSSGNNSGLAFDTAAARARKEEASKAEFTRFKQSQNVPPPIATTTPRPLSDTLSYGGPKPPPLPTTVRSTRTVYIPNTDILITRRSRIYSVFNPYWSRPVVIYHDPYSSLFWWWLLDRSLDDRAWWAYNHRYDMDPARYDALLAADQQLQARVEALEAQQTPRDPAYTPSGLDRDLMYSDQYVNRTYSSRPTMAGIVVFWLLGIPTVLAICVGFIWLVWFKRWQTAS